LEKFGAKEIARSEYLDLLNAAVKTNAVLAPLN
jgi:Leu/Phe-tRNA-protein transferase